MTKKHAAPATKKASVAKRAARVASSKAKSRKRATAEKNAPVAATKGTVRHGSKTAKILALLKRLGGATAKELLKATGWLPHSLRGFISGTVGKKMGLAVTSTRNKDGDRIYGIESTTPSSAQRA